MFPHHHTASTMLGWCSIYCIYDLTSRAPTENLHLCLVSLQKSFLKPSGSSLSVCQLWQEPGAADRNQCLVNVKHRAAHPERVTTAPTFSICDSHCGLPDSHFEFLWAAAWWVAFFKSLSLLSFDKWFLHSGLIWVQLVKLNPAFPQKIWLISDNSRANMGLASLDSWHKWNLSLI